VTPAKPTPKALELADEDEEPDLHALVSDISQAKGFKASECRELVWDEVQDNKEYLRVIFDVWYDDNYC
jgi:hypothetical protein